MTAGAPLGSLVAGRLFKSGIPPQAILHIVRRPSRSASVAFYLWLNRRDRTPSARQEAMTFRGGFGLVLEPVPPV